MAEKTFQRIRVNLARHMVVTPPARISFPSVFEPTAFDPEDKKVFKVNLIFDIDDLKLPYAGKKVQTPSIRKVLQNVKTDQWGATKEKWPMFSHEPLRSGDDLQTSEGEVFDGYAGKVYLIAKTGEKFPPAVLDRFGNPITDPEQFYGGCYARAQLIARPYKSGRNVGVRFNLLQLMKVRDGDRFGVKRDVFDLDDEADLGASGDEDDDDVSPAPRPARTKARRQPPVTARRASDDDDDEDSEDWDV